MVASARIVTCPRCSTRNRVRASPDGYPRCSVCHTPLPWVVDATAEDFDQEVASSLPVLVDLWAPWCGPCRMVSPVVERLGGEHAGRLKVVRVDVDAAPAISGRFGVQGIPTLLLVRGGREIDRLVGAPPPARLKAWVESHLAGIGEHGTIGQAG